MKKTELKIKDIITLKDKIRAIEAIAMHYLCYRNNNWRIMRWFNLEF